MSRTSAARSAKLTRRLLGCGVLAGPVFVSTFLLDGATRSGYDPLRHPVSSLGLGPRREVQIANFHVAGVLYLAYAAGLLRSAPSPRRAGAAPILIGASAVGMIGAGVFATDPVSGYPPGTPDQLIDRTTAGLWHDLLSVPTFLGLPGAAFVSARRFRRTGQRSWARYSAGSGLLMLVTFGMASAGFAQVRLLVNFGGLFQRVAVITGFSWLTARAVHALQTGRQQVLSAGLAQRPLPGG